MKKLLLLLVASASLMQSSYAAIPPLAESLNEYAAITSAIGTNPAFQNIIPVTEFIVDIKRITKQLNILGEVQYRITTRNPAIRRCCQSRYIATLNVAPNSGLGPFIVTVESLVKVLPNQQ